jgi:two-component system, LytTR family, response regulator
MVKKIKCAIVDDEQHALDLLKYHIQKVESLELAFENTQPIKAFEYIQNQAIDLLFLDIQMAELNGLDLLKLINGKCKVILTTAYSEHALESYEYEVVDYLLKPITFNRFLQAVQKAQNFFQNHALVNAPISELNKDFFVKSGQRNALVKIDLETLQYIESQGNYVYFHFANECIKTQLALKKVEAELQGLPFVRIHQSFIIAKNRIDKLEGNSLFVGSKVLPIGDKYRADLKSIILDKSIN